MKHYVAAFEKAADFKGRSRREEYWMFVLFNSLFVVLTIVLDNLIGINFRGTPYGPIYILYSLVVLVPGLALVVRRLHDTGKSGWNMLWSLIPFAGAIYLLVLMLTDSTPGPNKYGPNPKEENGVQPVESSHIQSTKSDMIILVIVIWMLFNRLLWTIMPFVYEKFYISDWYLYLNGFIGLIGSAVPIALAFVVLEKSKRTLLLILGGIYFAYGVVQSIWHLLNIGDLF